MQRLLSYSAAVAARLLATRQDLAPTLIGFRKRRPIKTTIIPGPVDPDTTARCLRRLRAECEIDACAFFALMRGAPDYLVVIAANDHGQQLTAIFPIESSCRPNRRRRPRKIPNCRLGRKPSFRFDPRAFQHHQT